MPSVLELRDKHRRLVGEARAIMDLSTTQNRDLTAEESTRYDALLDEADVALRMADRERRQTEAERRELEVEERARLERERARGADGPEQRKAAYKNAFLAWVRGGINGLNPEQRAALQHGERPLSNADREQVAQELRAMGTGTGGTPFGGFAVPEEFNRNLEEGMKDFNAIMRAPVDEFTTSSGASMPWPMLDDSGVDGELLAENTQAAAADVVLSSKTTTSFTYSSKIVLVSLQLLQDEDVGLEARLARALGARIGRITGKHFSTGTGSGQPQGITVGAVNSTVTFSIGTPTVYDDLVDLIHSVDIAYRGRPSFGLMFNDAQLKILRKLKDTTGVPIWQPNVSTGAPPTILGEKFYVNNDIPDGDTATERAYIVGDFQSYKVRNVRDVTLLRLTERYADFLQVGFLAFARKDGAVLDPGTGPLKYAAMVA